MKIPNDLLVFILKNVHTNYFFKTKLDSAILKECLNFFEELFTEKVENLKMELQADVISLKVIIQIHKNITLLFISFPRLFMLPQFEEILNLIENYWFFDSQTGFTLLKFFSIILEKIDHNLLSKKPSTLARIKGRNSTKIRGYLVDCRI